MTPTVFLEHAEELLQDGRPAFCRSAVSRGYYAAHHAAVSLLFLAGVRTPTGGTAHVTAYNSLLSVQGLDAEVYDAALDLAGIHPKRITADYRWTNLLLEDQTRASQWVQFARGVVEALEACAADQDRLDVLYDHFRQWVPLHGSALGLSLV